MNNSYKYWKEKYKYNVTWWNTPQSPWGMAGWSNGENQWCPSDTKESYEKNKDIVEKEGWTENNVSYKVNNYGFRHHEDFREDRDSLLAIGCSITFGIGVNYEQTWPYYTAKELGLNPINLGQPGGSIQACYRVAREWVPIIKPKVVMWFIPDPGRRELFAWEGEYEEKTGRKAGYDQDIHPAVVSHWTKDKKLLTYWETVNENESETIMHKRAYYDAMEHVCRNTKLIKIPVYKQGTTNKYGQGYGTSETSGVARDNLHPGPKIQREMITPLFVKAYKDI